jgi:hypothetical protein
MTEITGTLRDAPLDMTVVFASALVYELTGDRTAALQALAAAARGGHSVAEIRRHPDLARLREDTRFLSILKLIRAPGLQ